MNVKKSARWGDYVPSSKEQYETKRRAVLIEAGKAFGRNGFHQTSLDDVARALGVTKPALYRYAKNKNEILYECFNLAHDLGDQAMEEAMAANTSPLACLRDWLYRYVSLIHNEFQVYAVLAEPKSSLQAAERKLLANRRRRFDARLRALVSEAIEQGELPGGNPKLMVTFFMGAVNHIPHWFDPDGDLSGEEMARAYSAMGIAALMGGKPALAAGSSHPSAATREHSATQQADAVDAVGHDVA